VVTAEAERQINPQRVRDIFLGLNDGLVEILGAVSGFFGAFQSATTVLVAGSMVAVAGALSMGAGAYLAASSEAEIRDAEAKRRRFLGEPAAVAEPSDTPLASGLRVGASYVVGAVVPVLPVVLGARTLTPVVAVAGGMIVLVSMILAFLSGMDVRRRILMNLVIIGAAVAITYLIGSVTRTLWGIGV
jgi:VIT1/CCC1 family predicted Fe2+/Mn2+ transporter